MLVVLLQVAEGDVPLGAMAVQWLARLGVTSLALLCDERTFCVVLEGWVFDPAGSTGDVVSAFSAARRSVQTLQPAMQMAVAAVPRIGEAGTAFARGTEGGES
jgi:hypothetical protein